MRIFKPTSSLLLLAMLSGTFVSPTQGASSPEFEQRQEEIRSQVRAVTAQIAAILAEFERNGLMDSPEVATLRDLQSILASLTNEQMAEVIKSLRSDSVSQNGVEQAHERQQRILADFRSVLLTYRRQQSEYALAARVRSLMERQHTALRTTVDLIDALGPRATQTPDEATRASLTAQAREQSTLTAEVTELVTLLSRAPSTDSAKRFAEAARFAREARVLELMRQATSDLSRGATFNAAQSQQISRNNLRKLWRLVSPQRSRAQQLSDAALEVQQLIELQSGILTATREVGPNAGLTTLPPIDRRQGDAVDRTLMVGDDLKSLHPESGLLLSESVSSMQASRARLRKGELSLAEQESAVSKLTSARDLLLREIEKLEEDAQHNPASQPVLTDEERKAAEKLLEQVTQAQKELNEAIEKQSEASQKAEDATQATGPEREKEADEAQATQKEAEKAAQEAQQKAAESSHQAESNIDQARKKMDEADKQLESNTPTRAREAQRDAEDRLSDAQAQLEAQADRLREKLGKPSNDAEQADAAKAAMEKAAQQARQSEAGLSNPSETTQSQSQGMSESAKQLDQAGAESSGAVPDEARDSMNRAAEALRQGAAQAQSGDREAAKKSAQRAQEELAKAQQAARQGGGKPDPNADKAHADKTNGSQPPSSNQQSGEAADPKQANNDRGADPNGGTRGTPSADAGRYIGLPAREREAIQQSQQQKYPDEYTPQIEQYLRNLTKESKP